MTTYLPQFLALEGAESEPLISLLKNLFDQNVTAVELRKEVSRSLANAGHIGKTTTPAWLVLHQPKDWENNEPHLLEEESILVHLEAPMFFAVPSDGDVFYGNLDGYGEKDLVYQSWGEAYSLFLDKDGNTDDTPLKVSDKDIPQLVAYDQESSIVLGRLQWFEPSPTTISSWISLMEIAASAVFDAEMEPYTVPEGDENEVSRDVELSVEGFSESVMGSGVMGATRHNASEQEGPRQLPNILWRATATGSSGSEWGGNPVIAGDCVITSTSSYNLDTAVHDLGGQLRWTRTLFEAQGWPVGDPVVTADSIYQGSNKGLHALDLKTGKERWLYKAGGLVQTPPILANGVCYVLTKGAVHAIDIQEGRRLWRYNCKSKYYGGTAYAEGVLFFALAGHVCALDASTGKRLLWKVPGYGFPGVHPFLLDGERLICQGIGNGSIRVLRRSDGEVLWERACGLGYGDKGWAVHQGILVGFDEDGRLCALKSEDGQPLWSFETGGTQYGIGKRIPTIAGNTVFAVMVEDDFSQTRYLVAVDLHSGEELWRLGSTEYDIYYGDEDEGEEVGHDFFSWNCTPAVHQGVVYAQICNQMYALGNIEE